MLRLIGCSMNRMLATRRARRGRGLHALPQIEQGGEVVVLLVAVERDVIGLRDGVEHRRDIGEALQIGVDRAANLELEEAVAVVRNHVLERLRQSVADIAGMAGNGIEEADGVARGDAHRRRELRQEAPQVEAGEIARLRGQQGGIDAGEVRADRLIERTASAPAQGVERGAVDLCRTEKLAASALRPRAARRRSARRNGRQMAERGARPPRRGIGVGGEREAASACSKLSSLVSASSCRTTWARAFPPPLPNASCRREARCAPAQTPAAPA